MPRGKQLRSFHELMPHRVQRILLISSLYDSFIMSEEGHLHETLLGQFIDLNLSSVPDLVRVPTGAAARELLEEGAHFDLVVASLDVGDSDAVELAEQLAADGHAVPVVALAYTGRELRAFTLDRDTSALEGIFLWQGDVRILLAMVMVLEDRLNVEEDTGLRGVPVILVVEDSIRFYSSFLPAIYAELFRHTDRLLSQELNVSQRMLRMRARPKVLLCQTYEEAWATFERYEDDVLGVISDVSFPRDGVLAEKAGLDLCYRVSERRSDVRLVLQSSNPKHRVDAMELGASFLVKGSAQLLQELRELMVTRFGFGDFVFRTPDREVVDTASDLRELALKLRTVPASSVAYHASRNHFSNWLKARTEFDLAERLRPVRVSDFEDADELRAKVLEQLDEARLERQRTVIVEFDRNRFEPETSLTRIGGGSLGGKARGVAFANRILHDSGLGKELGVDLYVPPSVVLATQIFDQFLGFEDLRDFALGEHSDAEVEARFQEAPFPRRAESDLRAFLQRVPYPLAVRSSSLLEDSLSQPFAGIYQTYMLGNNDPDLDTRTAHLIAAVKRVFASVFSARAKAYLEMTSFRLEEEKMGVMIQQLVGTRHEHRFHPDFGGVARSFNYYPEPGQAAEDGVAAVALGLGRTVVDGAPCLRFCPRYPRQIVSFSSVKETLRSSQQHFAALDLRRDTQEGGIGRVERYPIADAEEHGPLRKLASTYSVDDDRIVDGTSRDGVRVVTFAPVLKQGRFPLSELLIGLLERCAEGTGGPVEIEFAAMLPTREERGRFAFLQLRPLAKAGDTDEVKIGDVDPERVLCRSPRILGNGVVDDLRDVVVVDRGTFDRARSTDIAGEVAHFDALLRKAGRPYLLVGVGRWGSADPSLGIPVGWTQIAGARVIVEAGLEDLVVAPSQGTHFFQNLSSGDVGYFTVNEDVGQGSVDWDWLAAQPAAEETGFVRHVRLERGLQVRMDGRSGEGVILRAAD